VFTEKEKKDIERSKTGIDLKRNQKYISQKTAKRAQR
jgi:hypothetical protein